MICVDLIVQRFPGKEDWRIQDSSVFLACSLSLSFGVMLFSALFSMLPSAKAYLHTAGLSDQAGGFILVGCFAGGYLGIQVVSRLLHRLMPSHVVDCDHSHGENGALDGHGHGRHHHHHEDHAHDDDDDDEDEHTVHFGSRQHSHAGKERRPTRPRRRSSHQAPTTRPPFAVLGNGHAIESTPLLGSAAAGPAPSLGRLKSSASGDAGRELGLSRVSTMASSRRPSMVQVQKRVMSFVKDTKSNCDEAGPCFGYSDPCGQECFKHLHRASSAFRHPHPLAMRTTTGSLYHGPGAAGFGRVAEEEDDDDSEPGSPMSPRFRVSRALSKDGRPADESAPRIEQDPELGLEADGHAHESQHGRSPSVPCSQMEEGSGSEVDDDLEAQHQQAQHHHHVPTNAFLSIGLQTSIAIALHKFPEGFITYATNHANPALGFSVFMALFVHNLTEGFAMALPLYLALGSRARAMAWSSLLGGLSQPLGAAIAVLWFRLANRTHMSPDAAAYGCLFAGTAGIMVSVALQLFVESLSLNHNRNLCIFCAFLGMVLMGLSSALVAGQHA